MAYELLLESFDTGLTDKWSYVNVASSVAGAGLRGTSCMRLGSSFSNRALQAFTPATHVVVGAAYKITVGGTQLFGFDLKNGSTVVGSLRIGVSGIVTYYLGGTAYASGITLPVGSWAYVEFGFAVADSGGVVSIRVNKDGQVLNFSGDTLVTAAASITHIEFNSYGGSSSGNWLEVDDLYIAYGNELKYLERWQVDALALTGNATPQDFTPDTGNAWERLNAATGYVSASAVDAKSLFESATITDTALVVHGVQVTAIAKTIESGPRQMAAIVSSNSVDAVGAATDINVGDTSMHVTSILNPDTGVAWTQSQIDAMQVGFKIVT